LAQRQFERQQQDLVQQAQVTNQARQNMARSIATAKVTMDDEAMGDGLGFDAVVAAGAGFLTEDDKAAVRAAGKRAGNLLYQICREYAETADTDEGDRIRASLKPAAKNTPKPSGTATPKSKQIQPPSRRDALRQTQTAAPTAAERLGIQFPDPDG
jgi:hypothetical protein